MTLDQLIAIMRCSSVRAEKFLSAINATVVRYEITTALRLAHFLAQVGHESGSLHYAEEIANGSAYEGRKDLGNIFAGDGKRFKGRGLIEITGRANYKAYGLDVGFDFLSHPESLSTPLYAADSAGWFWSKHNLNELADVDDLLHITRRINGGTNGLNDRALRLALAKKVLEI